MANPLLDFVLSLVRDPDAAARYAADPARAIADAHLTEVTSADVDNLLPVVSDSLSYQPRIDPASLADPASLVDPAAHANVWTGGAAAAALDAFTPHEPSVTSQHASSAGVITDPASAGGWAAPAASPPPAAPGFDAHDPAAPLAVLPGAPGGLDVDAVVDDAGAWAHQGADSHVGAHLDPHGDPHVEAADHAGPEVFGLDGLL